MSAYLLEVYDIDGTPRTTLVGPFEDSDKAADFANATQFGSAALAGWGGYSAVHVISDETCDYDPERYLEENRESISEHWAAKSYFVSAAMAVTDPAYASLPFDEDLTIFEEGGRMLLEHVADMTASEFDDYCRERVDAPSFVVLPFLFKLRDREMDA